MKKLKYLLQLYDGAWSIPLAFGLFFAVGLFLNLVIGSGSYDLAFIQPLFLAVAIVAGAANASLLGLKFSFRGLYRWLYGYKHNNLTIKPASEAWQNLLSWQKFAISLLVYFSFFFAVIFVYLSLV